MRNGDHSAPLWRFRYSCVCFRRHRRLPSWLGGGFTRGQPRFHFGFVVPSGGDQGSAEASAAATVIARSTLLPTSTLQGEDSAVISDPAASAPSPPGNPAPLDVLPPLGRISTRTRRRTAAAAGTAPPVVDYGFGPGGAPGPSVRRAITPPRVPRPRPPASVAMAPTPAASSVPTVPIPSDRDRVELVGTLLNKASAAN